VAIVDSDDVGFAVSSASAGGHRVVHISGELGIAARDLVRRACLQGVDLAIVVDMTDLTFMDCSGYGALIAARRILTDLDGSLTIRNHAGQPAHLLSLLSALEAHRLHQPTSRSAVPADVADGVRSRFDQLPRSGRADIAR
jgi:anti-anti-sigma factor